MFCVKCVCSFALFEKLHDFFLLTRFQGCWDFQKKLFVKTLLKVSSSALLDMLCSFLHSCLQKTSLITQFITYCFVSSLLKAFKVFPLLFVHYNHSFIACITLVMDFLENLVDLQARGNNCYIFFKAPKIKEYSVICYEIMIFLNFFNIC